MKTGIDEQPVPARVLDVNDLTKAMDRFGHHARGSCLAAHADCRGRGAAKINHIIPVPDRGF